MKMFWMGFATVVGLTSLSLAMGAVPTTRVTDDTAIYQHLSEIKAARELRPDFDGDIARLTSLKSAYREKLPSLSSKDARLSGPMKRISSQSYHYSGAPASARKVPTSN